MLVMMRGASMYPCTVALAPPSPTILGGDVMKFSINGGLFIECRIRIGIIEKVTPVSIMADLITAQHRIVQHRRRVGKRRVKQS